MTNCLATKANLAGRRVPCSSTCPICDDHPESVEHALLTCPWVIGVWFACSLGYIGNRQQVTSLHQWFLSLCNIPDQPKDEVNRSITILSFVMWSIWKGRCKAMFEHVRPTPLEGCLGNINRVGRDEGVVSPGLTWCAPPNLFLKLNVDASWQNASGLAGLGIIIKNHKGEFKFGKVLKTINGSVEIAEAQAIIEGLSFALENGITHVCVESDSRKDLKSKFSAVRWTWIPREANVVADPAVAIAVGGMGTEVWVDRPPSSLVRVLSRDGLPCPS
ncbi:unnamed protein product [Prunus armeniaca]